MAPRVKPLAPRVKASSAGEHHLGEVKRFQLGVLAFLSIGVALVAPVPWLFGLIESDGGSGLVDHLLGSYTANRVLFLTHVIGGAIALLTGPWQLMPRLRARRPRLHRATGYIYVTAVALAGIAALAMARAAWPGPVAQLGFGALAVAWLATTGIGLQLIVSGNRAGHREWMMRSFALAFAAVNLRLTYMPLVLAGVDEAVAYQIVAWASWVPNLIVAQLIISRRRTSMVSPRGLHAAS